MDVQSEEEEEEKTMTSTVSLPRFDLAETVVTAIGRLSSVVEPSNSTMADDDNHDDSHGMQYEYVTHVERNCDGSKLAAALSSREVKVYGRGDCTIRIEGTMTGHTGAITQIAFAPGDPRALLSSSQDGTVKGWDTRTLKESMNFGQSGEEIWSVALNHDSTLCATGKGHTVEFFDLRKAGKALGTYSESHTDVVTQVTFHPHRHSFLASGSEDGLMCYFDTAISSEEDALESVMNTECPVRTMGFFGPEGAGLYCCSSAETLTLWEAQTAQRIVDFGDIRSMARGETDPLRPGSEGEGSGRGQGWGVPVDYIVGCQYELRADRLWLIGGDFKGGGCMASVTSDSVTPEAVLGEGGHREQIRAFDWMEPGMVTGGEDAKLCAWRAPGSGRRGAGGVSPSEGGVSRHVEHGTSSTSGAVRLREEHRAGRAFRPYDATGRRR